MAVTFVTLSLIPKTFFSINFSCVLFSEEVSFFLELQKTRGFLSGFREEIKRNELIEILKIFQPATFSRINDRPESLLRGFCHFSIAKTFQIVVIDHPDRLHEGVADR